MAQWQHLFLRRGEARRFVSRTPYGRPAPDGLGTAVAHSGPRCDGARSLDLTVEIRSRTMARSPAGCWSCCGGRAAKIGKGCPPTTRGEPRWQCHSVKSMESLPCTLKGSAESTKSCINPNGGDAMRLPLWSSIFSSALERRQTLALPGGQIGRIVSTTRDIAALLCRVCSGQFAWEADGDSRRSKRPDP